MRPVLQHCVPDNSLERSGELPWITANRNRIEHCSLPTPDQLDTMARWDLIASSSIGFVYNLGDSYPDALGDERIERLLPPLPGVGVPGERGSVRTPSTGLKKPRSDLDPHGRKHHGDHPAHGLRQRTADHDRQRFR